MLRTLLRNTGWNLGGYVLPAVAAFACTPFLYKTMGAERFGLLSVAWALLGMFSLFDFGIGRALTRWVAELLRAEDRRGLAMATAVARAVSVVMGGAASALLLLALWRGGLDRLGVGPAVAGEAMRSALLLIAGVWLSVYGSALRGGLEGFQDFRRVNLVRIPLGIAIFLLPTLTALVTPDLSLAVAALVAARLVANLAMARDLARWVTPDWSAVTRERALALLGHGGWITLSNLVGPILTYADRFVISALLSPVAVPYFSVPADAISRVVVLPASVATAALPAIAGEAAGARSGAAIRRIVGSATRLVVLGTVPLTLAALLLARPLLELWMGAEFAARSVGVFRWLALGYGLNALAQVPFLAVQAMGRARDTGLWHTAQLAPYVLGLSAATRAYGLEGAAAAWTLRTGLDMLGMWWLLHRGLRALDDGANASDGAQV